MSRHWFLFSLAALAGAAGTREIPAAQPSDTATIVVRVPADAKVYSDHDQVARDSVPPDAPLRHPYYLVA